MFRFKFWSYFNEWFKMMVSYMVVSIRNEVGMVLGDNSKLVRCYMNNLEFMNNVMRVVKEMYLKGNLCVL